MDEIDFYLIDLASRFPRDREKYYLSYSGGRDSHFLYWFIKEYLRDDKIKVVSVNTYMEHPQISARMYKYADVVLLPEMKPMEIKQRYGIPCFSKWQDEMISRYQNGSRSSYLIERVTGIHKDTGKEVKGRFKLNDTAKNLLLSGKLHKVSPKCCTKLKKNPLIKYERKTGKKAILAVRGQESALRSVQYRKCFTKSGKFTPLYDLSNEMMDEIYRRYNIETPEIYQSIERTGCMGCPYGSWKKKTQKELELMNPAQRRFVVSLFHESYDVLGIDYKHIQEKLF